MDPAKGGGYRWVGHAGIHTVGAAGWAPGEAYTALTVALFSDVCAACCLSPPPPARRARVILPDPKLPGIDKDMVDLSLPT